MAKNRKPHSVDTLFYTHGLLCSSYPTTVFGIVATISILCSLPFFFTQSGELNWPKPWRSPWLNYRVPVPSPSSSPLSPSSSPLTPSSSSDPHDYSAQWLINNSTELSERTPSWFLGLPVAVIQQLYVHLKLNCEEMDQLCQRSFYGASKTTAALLTSRMETVLSTCQPLTHTAALKLSQSLSAEESGVESLGLLSPLVDSARGNWDGVLPYQTIKELLYGGFWEHRHVPWTPSGTRSHSFALSFVLEPTQENFPALTNCVQAIKSAWPEPPGVDTQAKFMKHFYFEPAWYIMDFAPLLGVYFIVFLYISFSVGKIDLVKSKFGLGFTACVTVFLSLVMSLGICSFFGLSISLSGTEVYPFVVVIIGLENTLIIVKAVMSTPEELEVKHRIATGLSKEGWVLTRNVLTLSIMLGIGVLAFNYTMKEFCIIAVVGLLCDFFLQLVFFPTVLSIDLRRMELTDLNPASLAAAHSGDGTPSSSNKKRCPTSLTTPARWRSRRVKFAYFLANARLISKALTVLLSAYLVAWFIQTETFHQMVGHLAPVDTASSTPLKHDHHMTGSIDPQTPPSLPGSSAHPPASPGTTVGNSTDAKSGGGRGSYWHDLSDVSDEKIQIFRTAKDGFDVRCEREMCWRPMVTTHWPRLLQHYGNQTEGRFLTLLPPLTLEVLVGFSSPHRPSTPSLSVSALHLLSHPNTKRVLFLLALGTALFLYFRFLVQLGRKRHARYQKAGGGQTDASGRVGYLRGHEQDIECMCVDAGMVVSASLDGDIRVWDPDPMKRRCVTTISRSKVCGDYLEGPSTKLLRARPAAEGCEDNMETWSANGITQATGKPLTTPPIVSNGLPQATSHLHHQQSLSGGSIPPPLTIPTTSAQQQMIFKSVSLQEIPLRTPPLSPSFHPSPYPPPTTVPPLRSHRRMPSLPLPSSLHSAPPPVASHQFFRSQSSSTHIARDEAPPPIASRPQSTQAATAFSNTNTLAHSWRKDRRHSLHGGTANEPYPHPLPPPSPHTWMAASPPPNASVRANPSESQPQIRHTVLPPPPPSRPPMTTPPPLMEHQISVSTSHSENSRSGSVTNVSFLLPPPTFSSAPLPPPRTSHSRSSSLGKISRTTHSRNRSHGNISLGDMSVGTSTSNLPEAVVSANSAFVVEPSANQSPEANGGYNFSRHFNLFSQFTSNMALEFCGELAEDGPEIAAPPVWCMEVWNNIIALGCGNGQIEAWDATTGSLQFCHSMTQAGVTTIAITSQGIITGHMDGFLHLIGHNGSLQHSIQAHTRPVSVMRASPDKVVTGGYDTVVKVHRVIDFFPLNSVFIHNGTISALTLIEPQGISCASGCSKGLVCCWELASGKCLHEFEEYGTPVLKLTTLGSYLVALFADECLRVWESGNGSLLHTIKLGGICHDITALGSRYLAASVEIDGDSLFGPNGSQGWCLLHRFKGSSLQTSQSSVTIYDLESGQKHCEKPLEPQNRGMALVRHLVAVDSAHVACSVGREVQIVPCHLKLKSE